MKNKEDFSRQHDRFKLQRKEDPFVYPFKDIPGYLDKCSKCHTVLPDRCPYCHRCLICNPEIIGDKCSECHALQERLLMHKKAMRPLCKKLAELGKNVCIECCSNEPKRCYCGKCLICNEEVYEGECKDCYPEKEKIRQATKAKIQGKDVCPNCYTIEPGRCHCGNCTTCYGGSYGECGSCESSDSDDD